MDELIPPLATGARKGYPDPDEPVQPCTFKAGVYGYALLCGVPFGLATLTALALKKNGVVDPWMPRFVVFLVCAGLVALTYMVKLRLDVSADGITYSNLFRERFVAYSEISSAVLINYQRAPNSRDPRRWTIVITPNPWTNKEQLKIPLTFFPTDACIELQRILHTGDGRDSR